MNLFSEIDPGNAEEMNVVVETPRDSRNKYEMDTATGIFWLDRVIPGAHDYPVEYGLVPQTLSDDGDALDAILLSSFPFFPGAVVPTRPIGVLDMIDSGEEDSKILGVPAKDLRYAHVKDISDVPPHTLKEIEHFFGTYKQLNGKEVVVRGFKGRSEAGALFERARKMYVDKKK